MKTWLTVVSIIAAGATALLTVAIAADKKAAPAAQPEAPSSEKSSAEKPAPKAAAPATAQKKSEPTPAKPPAQPPVAAVMPDTNKMTLLIQSYMVALAQANITGRYDVLHAFGSPDFQSRNSPAQLAQNFQKLRENLDMSQIILYPPTLTSFPDMGPDGIVKVAGVYKIPPQPLQFAMAMQSVSGMWRLAAISVSAQNAEPVAPTAETSASPSRAATTKAVATTPPVTKDDAAKAR